MDHWSLMRHQGPVQKYFYLPERMFNVSLFYDYKHIETFWENINIFVKLCALLYNINPISLENKDKKI